MYKYLEHSSNYSDMTGNLWFDYKDENTNFNNAIAEKNTFKFETKIIGSTAAANKILKNAITAVSLKYLSQFWRSLQMNSN